MYRLFIACRGKAQLADLEALQEEAEHLPAWVPEVKRINTLVQKAHDWLAKSGSMTSTRAPLKRMRDLLHSGTRLAVVVPEVEALRQEIRKREWCDAVKKVRWCTGSLLQTAAWRPSSLGCVCGWKDPVRLIPWPHVRQLQHFALSGCVSAVWGAACYKVGNCWDIVKEVG